MTSHAKVWMMLGFAGQFFCFSRFLVQWIESEKKKRSVVPHSFWYFSIFGGALLLAYAIYRRDPVFVIGQLVGLFVYFRNLWLIRRPAPGTAGGD